MSISDDHPSQIIINIPIGTAGENAAGELVVRPGSVVHLDCVFYRRWSKINSFLKCLMIHIIIKLLIYFVEFRLGTPAWFSTNFNQNIARNYPTGEI